MKEIKNILILTREYKYSNNQKVGGTGIFYRNLSLELTKRGINVSVFLISKNEFDICEDGVRIHSVKDFFKTNPLMELLRSFTGKFIFLQRFHYKIYLLEKIYICKKIKKWIKKNNLSFDLVETHDFEGLALSIPRDIPYVIRCHGSWSVLEKYFGYKNVHKGRIYCEKLAFEKSKNVITISQYNEKMNKTLFKIQKPRLIYNGIDEKFYKPIKNIKNIPRSIFYLGNLSFEKGADTLIESFLIIKKKYPDSSLHFIGNINHYEKLIKNTIKDTQVKNSILFYGNKNAKEIVELINQAEVVCFPSKGENFSLSLLEAMAIQKPIICSHLESFKEVIRDSYNGLIASQNDFHDKITLIFDDRKLNAELSFNARKSVENNFNIDKMVTNTINYYKEII